MAFDESNFLTGIREALWTDLNIAWSGQFKRSYDLEENMPPLGQGGRPRVTVGDLPCVMIVPATVQDDWFSNQEREVFYSLNIMLWTKNLKVSTAEQLWQLAVTRFMATTNQLVTDTNFNPVRIGVYTRTVGSIEDNQLATLWTLPVVCMYRWNPRS